MAENTNGKTKKEQSASRKKYNQEKRAKKADEIVLKKPYKTPTETWWGKILVWVIFFGMVGLVVLSFILALIEGNA
jgi:hypothetical protein